VISVLKKINLEIVKSGNLSMDMIKLVQRLLTLATAKLIMTPEAAFK